MMNTDKFKTVQIRIETHNKVKAYAEKKGMKIGRLYEIAFEKYVADKELKEKEEV